MVTSGLVNILAVSGVSRLGSRIIIGLLLVLLPWTIENMGLSLVIVGEVVIMTSAWLRPAQVRFLISGLVIEIGDLLACA